MEENKQNKQAPEKTIIHIKKVVSLSHNISSTKTED